MTDSDTMPELDNAVRLAQIHARSQRLADVPLETSASNYIMRDMIGSIGDVRWLLEQLAAAITRAEPAMANDPAPYGRWLTRNLGAAYAAGWEAHADLVTGTLATLGSSKREQCGRAWIAERLADLTDDESDEQPEPCDGDCDCDCQPGQPCLCPERDCYCGPCPVCDRDEAKQQPEDVYTADADQPEIRDRNAWCWNRHPDHPLPCGRLAGHDGQHARGERRWDSAEQPEDGDRG